MHGTFDSRFNTDLMFRHRVPATDDGMAAMTAWPADIRFKAGTLYKISGANGQGKSTLLQLIAGLYLPHQTNLLTHDGHPVSRTAIFYLPHRTGLRRDWTGWQNLNYWCALQQLNVTHQFDMLKEEIDLSGLSLQMDRPVVRLSAGQQQKQALLRLVLATRQPLWLLDEPEVHLDRAAEDRLRAHVAGHLARGGIVMWASHQIDIGLPCMEITL